MLNLSGTIFVALLSLPFVIIPSAAEASHDAELAVDAGAEESFLTHPSMRAYLADLLRLAGGGFRETERAAFLVIDDDGRYRCLLWPANNQFRRAQFNGPIPPGTVVVIHTHPNRHPRPSRHDQHEAERIGLPFLVVSRQHIYAVTQEGRVVPIVEQEWWSRDAVIDRERLCRKLPEDSEGARESKR